MNIKTKLTHYFIILTFLLLYLLISVISSIHVIDFFQLSNDRIMAITLAIAFELGAAASLAGLITLDKMVKWIIWGIFGLLTLMQMMGNMYYSYSHLQDFHLWSEMLGLNELTLIEQKRIISIVSGIPLPVIALAFIKSLVDYLRPTQSTESPTIIESNTTLLPEKDNDVIDDTILQKTQSMDDTNIIVEKDNTKDEIIASEKDAEISFDVVTNPQPPTEDLIELGKEYKEFIDEQNIESGSIELTTPKEESTIEVKKEPIIEETIVEPPVEKQKPNIVEDLKDWASKQKANIKGMNSADGGLYL